ncbi:MAG: hypothetical protein ACK4NZ_02050 [Tsuneonella sp.]
MKGFAIGTEGTLVGSDDLQAMEATMPRLQAAILAKSSELVAGVQSIEEFDRKLAGFNFLLEAWNTNETCLSMALTARRAMEVADSLKWPPVDDS